MMQKLCFCAALCIVLAIPLDAFSVKMLPPTTVLSCPKHIKQARLHYALPTCKVSKDYGDKNNNKLIFESDFFKAGQKFAALFWSYQAVAAMHLAINLLLWCKIGEIGANIDIKPESSIEKVNNLNAPQKLHVPINIHPATSHVTPMHSPHTTHISWLAMSEG